MLNRRLRLLTVALGLWVVLSSLFLWRTGSANAVNSLVTGLVIIASALIAIPAPGFRYVTTAAGVWLVASLFAWPNYTGAAVWNNVMVGAAVALVSLVGPREVDMISS